VCKTGGFPHVACFPGGEPKEHLLFLGIGDWIKIIFVYKIYHTLVSNILRCAAFVHGISTLRHHALTILELLIRGFLLGVYRQ